MYHFIRHIPKTFKIRKYNKITNPFSGKPIKIVVRTSESLDKHLKSNDILIKDIVKNYFN